MNNLYKQWSIIGLLLLLITIFLLQEAPSLYLFSAASNHGELEAWARTIQGRRVFSQNDEDGAIEAVFERIGTNDKVYVEFGVENCSVCISRNLRWAEDEEEGFISVSGRTVDGMWLILFSRRGFENLDINLHKVADSGLKACVPMKAPVI